MYERRKMHPLEVMIVLSTEDWVIMQKDPQSGDEHHLGAGAMFFFFLVSNTLRRYHRS